MQPAEQRDEVEMLSLMLLIRRFEERASQQYQAQKIGGFCHLYIGQEAVVVGAVAATRHDDYIITAYRDHAHALAQLAHVALLVLQIDAVEDDAANATGAGTKGASALTGRQ